MASVNLQHDDIGSINAINDDIDQDTDALEETLIRPEEDDRDIVACLPPKDRYWGVYAIFYFLGITTLLPWNFFINADQYWMYKFRNVNETANDTGIEATWDAVGDDHYHSPHGKTHFQASFTSYLAIASNIPSTLCFLVNTYISRFISSNTKIIVSLAITFVVFLASTVLVQVNTDAWQQEFFIVTMVSVVLMNSFCSFFQCGLLGIVGKFPSEYTTATMSGQALGGIFAACANILSIFLGADQVRSALIYFVLGSGSLLFSLCVAVILPKTIFYKFYVGDRTHQAYRWIENYPPEARLRPPEVKRVKSWMFIFKKVWSQAFAAMMTFVVTLAGFPALVVLVVSEEVPSIWNDKYYHPVVSFLVFACGDYLGRIFSGSLKLPEKNSHWTLIIAVLRIGLIPMIMMSNLQPRHYLPVVFNSDIEFAIISFFFGFSNGYLANIVFINAPQLVSREDQEDANGVVTTFLGLGLSIGVTLSYFLLKLV
ncbi:unnamed protein product [Orchesella dallaii]|uniref:Equilibrative nucleoside transporter 3 n=1 Tax=Orchesella dallaii TaxID=48710 RepID=A0ABP1RXK2_9HEXA